MEFKNRGHLFYRMPKYKGKRHKGFMESLHSEGENLCLSFSRGGVHVGLLT